ncbi:MAG: excinuclease ABC subunit UvrB [Alistipes sp.]|nr:excinuclease ABC subunit UvrB [Alistipes sp.]
MDFKLVSDYAPMGDQPEAIEQLVAHLEKGVPATTLHGVTGSGKTFTMANVIARLNRPVLVLSHNKTLAAQLYSEFKSFFPENAVEYFVSYYDYYQPEAYIPSTDTYIEKDLAINAEIDRMRLSATYSLLSGRRDVIVVASVSCIYGIGNPADFHTTMVELKVGDVMAMKHLMYRLVEILYTRVEGDLENATFRVKGDTITIRSSVGNHCYRITFFDDEIEEISRIDADTGQRLDSLETVRIYPANLFVPSKARVEQAVIQIENDLETQMEFFTKEGRDVEARRIEQRVHYDLEMIKELGYCSGIENYSRYFDGRSPGMRPFCLLDYFPEDALFIIDESHVTVPQVRGMFGGDRSRKENLVEYGFRLPAARDNRPLRFEEFEAMQGQTIYVSATPAPYELARSEESVVEQFIRPTGIIDPALKVIDSTRQIDRLMEDIEECVKRGEKMIVTTISKRMCEEVSAYLEKMGVRSRYIHSDLDTLERVQIIQDMHADLFDVLCGVNLLREGIDLPEVSQVSIFDADKNGYLRNYTAMTQVAGRAARHAQGRVVLYGTTCTDAMRKTVEDSNRRRERQIRYNIEHGIMPRQAKRNSAQQSPLLENASENNAQGVDNTIYNMVSASTTGIVADTSAQYSAGSSLDSLIEQARKDMERAAKSLDFMAAARYRDRMYELQQIKEEQLKTQY